MVKNDSTLRRLRASITLPLTGLDVVPSLAAQTAVLLSYASVNRHDIERAADRWFDYDKRRHS